MTTMNNTKKFNPTIDWFVRFLKGIMVGIGFITPGLSGGVMAVVFGIYEPLMRFLGNFQYKFIKNVLYFIPVGIGGVLGMVVFAAVVDIAFTHNPGLFTWMFIGFIAGTFPLLFKTSAKQGRSWWHWLVLAVFAVGTLSLMLWMENFRVIQLESNFINWVMSGALIGLGVVVPGMSPSNFLIYLGMYQPMAAGIRMFDLAVMIPLVLGGIACVLIFAKLVAYLFKKYYTFMYHFILGVVVGSTLAIIPADVTGWDILLSVLLFFFGALCSFGLSKLDEKFEREDLFA